MFYNFRQVFRIILTVLLQGLLSVVNHLMNKKQGHPKVVVINLRQDMFIECNGETFSLREKTALEEPVIIQGIQAKDIEVNRHIYMYIYTLYTYKDIEKTH